MSGKWLGIFLGLNIPGCQRGEKSLSHHSSAEPHPAVKQTESLSSLSPDLELLPKNNQSNNKKLVILVSSRRESGTLITLYPFLLLSRLYFFRTGGTEISHLPLTYIHLLTASSIIKSPTSVVHLLEFINLPVTHCYHPESRVHIRVTVGTGQFMGLDRCTMTCNHYSITQNSFTVLNICALGPLTPLNSEPCVYIHINKNISNILPNSESQEILGGHSPRGDQS